MTGPDDVQGPRRSELLAATRDWFEVNSGWAPPDPETLADWLAEGICRAPDDCWVGPDGSCTHGLTSWAVVLDDAATEASRWAKRALPTD